MRRQRMLSNRPPKDQRKKMRQAGIPRTQRRQSTKSAIRNRVQS